MAFSSVGRRRAQTPVYLNIYDLAPSNDFTHPVGIGFYHSGVEVMGKEYTFAATAGIFDHSPRAAGSPPAKFREQIQMGMLEGGTAAVQDAIRDLGYMFGPNDYNILQNNCNHFSSALCRRLTQTSIPAYVNRMSDLGSCCSYLIPKKMLEGAPVNSSHQQEAPTSQTMSRTAAFSGNGARLGGASRVAHENDSLTDRREKARMAALARLEKPKNNSEHDE